jgi:hypothetical protein
MTSEDELLQESVETIHIGEPTYRVAFERDDGQEYGVGARVTVHAMNSLFRTVDLNPSSGNYQVMRCERIRDTGWKALRISLHLVNPPESDAAPSVRVADGRR